MKPKRNLADIEQQARAFLLNAGLNETQIKRLEDLGYFTAPASMRHHLAVEGGLMEHSINVTRRMLELNAFSNSVSCYRVGMLHDLVKCKCYRKAKTGSGYVFAKTGLPGHGSTSAHLCALSGISLYSDELAAIVWHMGPFNMSEDDMKEYERATLNFPREIILTHAADHIASVFETLAELSNEENEE